MAATQEAFSRSETVYQELRLKLLSGGFEPNQRLKLAELCTESQVSVSVMREALTRLAEQGLVQSQPNKGFTAPSFTAAEISDLGFMRGHIEGLAIRLAIERGGPAWEASVVAAHHELTLTPRVLASVDSAANQQWSRVHSAFHAACAEACGSPQLLGIRRRLYDEAEVVRQMADLSGADRDVEAEHAAILDAVVKRDSNRAVELISHHVLLTAELSVDAWQMHS